MLTLRYWVAEIFVHTDPKAKTDYSCTYFKKTCTHYLHIFLKAIDIPKCK